MQRYFAIKKIDNGFLLSDGDIHHIKHVMRCKIYDKIEVVYSNTLYICSIENLDNFSLKILDEFNYSNEKKVSIILAVGLVSEQKMDLILQKSTELGVSQIIPVSMERSIVKLDYDRAQKKIKRWNLICKEASEQSKRIDIPFVHNIINVNDLSSYSSDLKLVCCPCENSISLKNILNDFKSGSILIVIGPEGGISEQEVNLLSSKGFIKSSLGKNVLRVETAAICALSNIVYEFN